MLLALILTQACDANIFSDMSPAKNTPEAKIEDARLRLDDGDYNGAVKVLEGLKTSDDSNEIRVLLAAALLGKSGFDFWNIILNIYESANSTKQENGVVAILESFSDNLLGTGEIREERIAALASGLENLQTAPEPTAADLANLSCLFGGILTVPTVVDAQRNMTAAIAALQTISARVGQGNPCDTAATLTDPIDRLNIISKNLSGIINATKSCAFLADAVSSIETKINTVIASADKGCATLPSCPASFPGCRDLFPTCVQQELGVGGTAVASAGDKAIAACEIMLHCTVPSECFAL
jgi:hypothetical protein